MNEQYNTIEEAIEDLRAGKIILVTDDLCCSVCNPGKY